MSILFLFIALVASTVQNFFKKNYNKKVNDSGTFLFMLASSLSALLFFVLTTKNLAFNLAIIPYSLLFGTMYLLATIFGYLSIATGPLFLTSLFTSFSLLIPTFYGLIFLHDKIKPAFIPGLILTFVSLVLITKKGKNEAKVTLKWIVFVALFFISNGMCSVSQKMQQLAFDGAYKNEFMIFALAFVCVCLLVISFKERKEIKKVIKPCLVYAIPCGISNGAVNLFVMILTGMMATSVLFPSISAGGIIISYFVSRFYYKETLSKKQLIGSALATIAVVLLNL